jgi:hypothetical protein
MEAKSLDHDPIFWGFELPLRAVYYPLGFPLEVVTNSHAVLAAAEASWGRIRQHFDERAPQIYVGVLEGTSIECPPAPVVRGRSHLMTSTADAENFATCDLRSGYAFCWLTRAVAENASYLRYYFLEAVGLTLLEQWYTVSLHAACVEWNGQGVLLCGDSGAGKSSLALACARRGWTFLSDDGTSMVRKRKRKTVIGSPYQMRFRESAIELFPELRERSVTTRGSKQSIEVNTDDLPGIRTAWETEIDHIVFLDRKHPDPPSLTPFSKAEAGKWLETVICFGEEEVQQSQRATLGQLMTAQIHQLHYSDLDWAVDRLETMVEQYAEQSRTPAVL